MLDGSRMLGGILVKMADHNLTRAHSRWKYNHLAVATRGKGIGDILIKAADDFVGRNLKSSVKLELSTTKENQKFFKKHWFKFEGKLSSHYRLGETAYIFGKLLK